MSFPSAPTAGLPARRAAMRLLDAVLRRGETLDQANKSAMGGVVSTADQALARAIAGETLRWLVDLDALIDSATRQRLADDSKARTVLRIMLAQWLRLGTPPHAVVATGLPLLTGGPRRLAHGVFGSLVRGESSFPQSPTLPQDVAERWGERAEAIAASLGDLPPLDLSFADAGKIAGFTEALNGEAVSLAPKNLRLPRGHAVEELPGFADGEWWVQDLAASIPVTLLGDGQGRRVLDLCSAPGGKTLQLAAAGWEVTSVDSSERRLKTLRANLERTGLSAKVICANILEWKPKDSFDAILLDAPCTATGTLRRHPDVIHRIFDAQIAEMAELQQRLLERAAGWLAPGGTLVYAVCSLEEAEGKAQVEKPLDGMTLSPVAPSELPKGIVPTDTGCVRTDPGVLAEQGGMDGFFIARWTKA